MSIGRQKEIKTPLGFITKFEYADDTDNNLLVLTVTDAENKTTISYSDGLGRLTKFVNADNTALTYKYDGNDNLTKETNELGKTTIYTYDLLNRQETVTTPLGNETTYTYDKNGNVLTVTDQRDNATTYTYNELNLLSSEKDARSFITYYTYDDEENLASVKDPLNNVTEYTYDKLNRLETETQIEIGTRTYDYDEVGNLTQLEDRNGRIVQFGYDAWNRQIWEAWLEGDAVVKVITYDYDGASQLIGVEDDVAKYSYEYDDDSRLERETRSTSGATPKVVLDYDYDDVGNLSSIIDQVGGVSFGVQTYTYDDRHRLKTISQEGNGVTPKTAVVSYYDNGQLKQLEVEDVFTTSQTFDDDTRLTGKTHVTEAGETLAYSYEYEGTIITKITSPNGVTTFGYDDTDQLTSANSDFQANQSYNYDATGNRQGDKIGSHNRLESDGVYTYEYDGEGNRISRTEIATGVVTTYVWDWRNRLVEISQSNELDEVVWSSEYKYDAFDRRLGKSVDGDGDGIYELVEDFVYHGDSIYLVLTGDEISQRYFYGPGTDLVLAEETAEEGVEYALTNHLNSVEFILDSAGKVINEIVYDSFGSIVSETHPGVNVRYGFTGRDFDKETGLGFYRTRYYDFVTRRFVSQDLLGFAAGDVNLYRYVGNTPTVYVDPSGMIVETIWDVASVLLGVASFAYNVYQGVKNRERSYFVDAGFDLVGIVADVGAVLLPGFPAVGAATIRVGRFALRAETAIEIAQVANVGVNAYQATISAKGSVQAFQEGRITDGFLNAGGALLSGAGVATSFKGSAPGNAGNLLRKGRNVINDIFGEGSWPRGGRRLVTAAESLGTAGRIDASDVADFNRPLKAQTGKVTGSSPGNSGDLSESSLTFAQELELNQLRASLINDVAQAAAPVSRRLRELDPNVKIGVRGSLARGFKGLQKNDPVTGARVPFNPDDFDVDAFIVSDEIAEFFGDKKVRIARNNPELDELFDITRAQDEIDNVLRKNPAFRGLREFKKTGKGLQREPFTFRVFTESEVINLLYEKNNLEFNDEAQVFLLTGD